MFRHLSLHLNESSVIPHGLDMTEITTAVRNLGEVSCGSSTEYSFAYIHIAQAIKLEFVITTLDETEKAFELAGEDVTVKLCHLKSNGVVVGTVEYNAKEKRYYAALEPKELGEHKLIVNVRNRPIHRSPFSIWVREPKNWKELSSIPEYISSSIMGGSQILGLAIHSNGDLFVSQSNQRICVVDISKKEIKKEIGKSGSSSSEDGKFNCPQAISINGDYLYCADKNNHRIQKFSATEHDDYAYLSNFGEKESGDKQLNNPCGICVGPNGTVFVSDNGNNRVAIFEANATFRQIVHNEIKSPFGITFDPHGNLHVVSCDSSIVSVFTPDGLHAGQYGKGDLKNPRGIAIDEEGYSFVVEYVSSSTPSRLQVFDPQHKLVKTVSGAYNYSEAVIIARDGSLIIADRDRGRILKC